MGEIISRELADRMLDAYKQYITLPSRPLQTLGLWHDADSMMAYLTGSYAAFVQENQDRLQLGGYEWQVGFYYALSVRTNNNPCLTCCLIPTQVNLHVPTGHPDRILEYDVYRNNAAIYPSASENDHFIYDTGEIWPG
jgi:hypothetical protein